MSRVQPVPGTSWKNIGIEADKLISTFYPTLLESPGEFPVIDFLEMELSKLGFDWEVVNLKAGCEAEVDFEQKVLRLSEATYLALHGGDRRARFTVMHEVGHVWLHTHYFETILRQERPNVVMHRSNIPPYKDPECQANIFSACILMPTRHVFMLLRRGKTYFDFYDIFNVSLEAAINRVNGVDKFK